MIAVDRIDIDDVVLDVKGAAKVFDIKVDAMYKRAQKGLVPSHKIGKRRVFLKSELIAYIRNN